MKTISIATFTLSVFLLSCDGNSQSNITKPDSIQASEIPIATDTMAKTQPQIDIFHSVDKVINVLSGVGIGSLGRWRDDEMGGYMSITPYYEFGTTESSMPNNIAYYLESTHNDRIETIKLVLNINNRSEKALALKKFKDIGLATFKALQLNIPNGLPSALSNIKKYTYKDNKIKVDISLEKSRIDTWKLTIEPK